MSRAQRLLRLVQLLRRYRAPVSAATLAQELQVSVRSIYRDVTTLREQGAAIEGEAGMGYLLKPGFLLPPLMFAEEELEAIILGLRLTVEHGDEALGRAAAEVVAKLRAVLPRDLRALIEVTALLAGPAGERPSELAEVSDVRRALRRQRKMEIDYVDRNGAGSTRTIWPLALGFFERARVVVAWCEQREDFRSFRTDRIARWLTLEVGLPRAREVLLREWRDREGVPVPI